MISDSDKKAAEDWAKSRYWDAENAGDEQVAMDVQCGIEDYLAGIEHERRNNRVILGADTKDGWYKISPAPIEQVGDKYWRVKDE